MSDSLSSIQRVNAKKIWNRTLSIERTAERMEADVEAVRAYLLAAHPNVALGRKIPHYTYSGPASQARRKPSLPALKFLSGSDV